ncbi:MAG: UvrB/UvrC motif-containing protein [Candidatus Marinimicrobia bacterium]|nr:UvrB/UvrC motif-containing protein [Candidatus Neomarinimicrobiota bacterium]MCF7827808.1 UvrB/UvrC motif-containing protein [Candidatus Neomarinimicrobiota bacterium]MCF7879437.1 UvrB/UvrC motif-containing protein [Candidatus Neomarinimicrobiota bacterium]
MSKQDISDILNNWEFDPDILNVRKITGRDGNEKIQLRLDLGLLQMEAQGRPDGQEYKGYTNVLDFIQSEYYALREAGEEDQFELTADDLRELQQESIQYYHRYLCFAELGDYSGVIRDTAHNLEVLEFVEEFAKDEESAWAFMQYYPYVKMMQTQAKIQQALENETYRSALEDIDKSIKAIRDFNKKWGIQDSEESRKEITILEEWRETVLEEKPLSKSEKLKADMEEAVRLERYEDAARIRDQLEDIQERN